jgi:hypothetical protein
VGFCCDDVARFKQKTLSQLLRARLQKPWPAFFAVQLTSCQPSSRPRQRMGRAYKSQFAICNLSSRSWRRLRGFAFDRPICLESPPQCRVRKTDKRRTDLAVFVTA